MAKPKRAVKRKDEEPIKAVAKKNAGQQQKRKTAPPKPAKKTTSYTPQKRKAPDAHPGQPVATPAKRRRATQPALLPVSHTSHGTVPAHLFLWGDGGCGQLGMGEDVVEKYRPALLNLPGGKKLLQVACGGMHTVALAEDGTVYTWGVNDEGALGRETEGELCTNAAQATGTRHPSDVPVYVPLPERIVQVTAGDSHTCALTAMGSVYSWGTFRDASGVMGFGPQTRVQLLPTLVHEATTPETQLVQIASGADHVVGLTAAGRVVTWGNGQQGQLGRVGARQSGRTKFSTLLEPHEVLIKRRRGVRSSKVVQVNAGTYATFLVLADGTLLACGVNNYGQLGLPASAGELIWEPTRIPGLPPINAVKGGQHHTLALAKDGTLLAFGRPTYGRLGRVDAPVGEDAAMHEAGRVSGMQGVEVTAMAAGLAVSGCVGGEGGAWAWGFGTNYQLGRGDDDDDAAVPVRIAETKNMQGKRAVAMEFGGQHAAMLAA